MGLIFNTVSLFSLLVFASLHSYHRLIIVW